METNLLVGTWRLVSWQARGTDGIVHYPVGQAASGYILYAADGYMSVAIAHAQRAAFARDDLLAGSLEERAAAAATYISYAGRYELLEDRVVHHVELSLFPNWVGTRQERFYAFVESQLVLSTPPLLAGGSEQRHDLVWARVAQA